MAVNSQWVECLADIGELEERVSAKKPVSHEELWSQAVRIGGCRGMGAAKSGVQIGRLCALASRLGDVKALAGIVRRFSWTIIAIPDLARHVCDTFTEETAEEAVRAWDAASLYGVQVHARDGRGRTTGLVEPMWSVCARWAVRQGWPKAIEAIIAQRWSTCSVYRMAIDEYAAAPAEELARREKVMRLVCAQTMQYNADAVFIRLFECGLGRIALGLLRDVKDLTQLTGCNLVIKMLECPHASRSGQGAEFIDLARLKIGHPDNRCLFTMAVCRGAIAVAVRLARGCDTWGRLHGDDPVLLDDPAARLANFTHVVCRALVASACHHDVFSTTAGRRGEGAPSAWSVVAAALPAMLPERKLDIRNIHPHLVTDFVGVARRDANQLAASFDQDPPKDYLLMGGHASDTDTSGRVGDALVRICDTFRRRRVRIVMSETQRLLRDHRYGTVCLVVAAWLKRLGLAHIRVRAIARDMIAGWL